MARLPYVVTPTEAARRKRCYLDTPGLYAVTLVRGGVEVAARVTHEPTPDPSDPSNPMARSYFWSLFVNGELAEGPSIAVTWLRIGRRITLEDYDYLLELRAYQKKYAPHEAGANPRQKIDVSSEPVVEFRDGCA